MLVVVSAGAPAAVIADAWSESNFLWRKCVFKMAAVVVWKFHFVSGFPPTPPHPAAYQRGVESSFVAWIFNGRNISTSYRDVDAGRGGERTVISMHMSPCVLDMTFERGGDWA